ncbi:hypothetical protein EHW67_15490 [Arenibacter aquaticus]|uniref:Uncharacterized protein n=1 Tax=Arenibacter aquaticus TaxID=2489054 RepID=A0A430K106_9FLAO|nr:hypothetical protein EHW67_15490 [Arenibacter aquaticus]
MDESTIEINPSGEIQVVDNGITANKINNDVAGVGLAKNATNGSLEVDTSVLNGSGNITSSDITVTGGTGASFTNVTLTIADNVVTASKIAADAISGGPSGVIAANTISQGDIGDNAIGAAEIQSNAVSSDEIDDDSITDADINSIAAIAGTKINPNFGTQNVITTGTLNAGNTTITGDLTVTNSVTVGATLVHPDYVFQKYYLGTSILNKNYTFNSLTEIEKHVKEKHHLPGVKSAEEIKEQGFWNLGEASRINLEKIEELFLHTIEQEKKIKQLKSDNESLSNELKALKKDMEEIKALLKNNKEQ